MHDYLYAEHSMFVLRSNEADGLYTKVFSYNFSDLKCNTIGIHCVTVSCHNVICGLLGQVLWGC